MKTIVFIKKKNQFVMQITMLKTVMKAGVNSEEPLTVFFVFIFIDNR
jgi:hypothetical protein